MPIGNHHRVAAKKFTISGAVGQILRRMVSFWLFDVLVLSPPRRTVLVLVIEAIRYSNLDHWSASYRKPPRSTVGIVEVQTAIDYEYRFTEYRPPRRTEYEYDEIRCEVDQVV